jgi:chromatin remodeling complex protein RSC6
MGIPDNDTLRSKLRGILKGSNLETLTKRAARRELEKSFSLEEGGLDERKQEIASWVDEYIEENDKTADEPPVAESAERSASEADEDEDGDDSKESTAKSAKKGKSARGWKPQWLKPALAEFVGTDQMKRTDVVKMIWDHVRSNNLQVCVRHPCTAARQACCLYAIADSRRRAGPFKSAVLHCR